MSQTTTVQKLQSLIEALDLMNEEEEWTPTTKQWNRIKEMIESLEETVVAAAATPVLRSPAGRTTVVRAGANPALTGTIAFPEVPVGEPPVGAQPTSVLSESGGVTRGDPIQSADGQELPANPPASPGT